MLKPAINTELEKRILVIDGAMGTMVQRYKLSEAQFRGERFKNFPHDLKGNNDLLSITQPEIIKTIHREYLEAGADIIETNTLNSNRVSLSDYHMEDMAYEINLAAAKLANECTNEFLSKTPDKPRYVAGSIGPTTKTASMSPDVDNPGFRSVTFDDLVLAYTEQVNGLLDGGAELLLIETIFDTLNAKAAIFAISEIFKKRGINLPVMVSGTITDASGRTLRARPSRRFSIRCHISIY